MYWGNTFFQFFKTMFFHIVDALQGKGRELAIDEIQIIILVLIGVASAIVGSFLVVRKMAMVANAISHTVLLGVVGSFLILHFLFKEPFNMLLQVDMKILILSALLSSLLTMLFTDFFHHTLKLGRDASIGLVFTFLFSGGVVLITLFTRNIHIGAELIMGNVDMLHKNDIWIGVILLIFNILCFTLFFKEYLITSFDPEFAKLSKISPAWVNYIVIFQTSITLVGAFRAVGVVLVLAFLVVPPVTARLFVCRLKPMIYVSCLISFVAALISVALSRHVVSASGISLSTSGLMVTLLALAWLFSLLITKLVIHKQR